PSAISVISVKTSVSSCSNIPEGLKVNTKASFERLIQSCEAFSSTKNQLITSILLCEIGFHMRMEVFETIFPFTSVCDTSNDMLGNTLPIKFFKFSSTSYCSSDKLFVYSDFSSSGNAKSGFGIPSRQPCPFLVYI